MLADPFAFLRGSAALMAYDLSRTPVSGIHVQACGDCHLANFGLFATPERNLVFDLNDFDETLPAPWEWDIKRLAASVVVAGRSCGISDSSCEKAVFTLAETYRTRLRKYAKMRVLDVWYSRLDDSTLIQAAPDAEAREHRKRVAAKARVSVTEYLFPKLTIEKDGRRHIVDNPPLIFHMVGEELKAIAEAEMVIEVSQIVKNAAILDTLATLEEAEAIKTAIAADVVRTLAIAEIIEEAAVEEAIEALEAANLLEAKYVEQAARLEAQNAAENKDIFAETDSSS